MKLKKFFAGTLATTLVAGFCCGAVGCRDDNGSEFTLKSLSETLTVEVKSSTLYIKSLKSNLSENLISEDSEYELPKYGVVDGKQTELDWKYSSSEEITTPIDGVKTSGVIYRFKEKSHNLEMRVYCTVHPDLSGPFEIYTEIDNLNASNFRIEPRNFASLTIDTPEEEKTNIMRIAKEGWTAEGYNKLSNYQGTGIYTQNVADMSSDARSNVISKSAPTSTNNGYDLLAQYIDRGDDGVFVALEWPEGVITTSKNDGSLSTVVNFDFSPTKFDYLMEPRRFSTEIPANTTFKFPSVYIMPYTGGIDNASNVFKSWFFDCKVVDILRSNSRLPYTQTDGDFGSPDTALQVGLESVKWDYGWWSGIPFSGDADLYHEGAWTAVADGGGVPGGKSSQEVAAYGALLNEKDLNFVTYILLHDTIGTDGNPTDEFGEFNSLTHPEWFSNQKHPYSKIADLGNEECVAYLKNKLETFFKTNNVDSWRTDFEPIASYSNQKNRHDANGMDVTYWCTVGFTEIIEHLYNTVDNFKFESCNSGGCSKDLYHATLATVINCDDMANYLSLRMSFYDSSYVIHPAQLQFPCNPDTFNTDKDTFSPKIVKPDAVTDANFKEAMMDMGFRTCIMGSPMVTSWTEPSAYLTHTEEYYKMYSEKIRPLVRDGELYHILPRPDGQNWDGMMYADPDSANAIKGLVFLFKPSTYVPETKNVVLKGLNPNIQYQLTFEDHPELNCVVSGAELMSKGIDATIQYIGSELIWITEA